MVRTSPAGVRALWLCSACSLFACSDDAPSPAEISEDGGALADGASSPADAGRPPLHDAASAPDAAPASGDAGALSDAGEAGGGDPGDAAPALGDDTPLVARGVRVIGRADLRDATRVGVAWSGAGVEARFEGNALQAELSGDGNGLRFAVRVDDAAPFTLSVGAGSSAYWLAQDLPAGVHTVALTRETEGQMGSSSIGALTVQGGALGAPPRQPRPLLELVGDSISAGFGILGEDESCSYSYETQSFAQTYGARAARALGGEAVGIALSSHGLVRNLDGTRDGTVPSFYGRALTNDPDAAWDAPLHPDVIVVHLGTNDYNAGDDDPSDAYRSAYLDFVSVLRARHPHALIVAAFGSMLADPSLMRQRDSIGAVLAARSLAGDSALDSLEFPLSVQGERGCAWHPNAQKHAAMAAQLVELLRRHGY